MDFGIIFIMWPETRLQINADVASYLLHMYKKQQLFANTLTILTLSGYKLCLWLVVLPPKMAKNHLMWV